MRLLKLTGLLMLLSMLAVGCSSDDDEDVVGGEAAELYVYVRDASDDFLLIGVDVEFVQNNKVLCIDTTDDNGLALCNYKWDDLVSGTVTVNINIPGYKSFTRTGKIQPGSNEWEVSLTPDEGDPSVTSSLTVTPKEVEDLYGTISIEMPEDVQYVRVSEGNNYDSEDYTEYTNDNYGYGATTQYVTYNNLLPETKYTFTVASFNDRGRQLDKKTVSITTKKLYHWSNATANVTDFLSLRDGIAVTLDTYCNYYLACYEVENAPEFKEQVVKDALSASSKQTDSSIGYVYGLEPGQNYRIYVVPVAKLYIQGEGYGYDYDAPGDITFVDVTTKPDYDDAAALVEMVSSTKTSFTYRFSPQNGCAGFKKMEVVNYDKYEEYPDIALAVMCQKDSFRKFDSIYGYYSDTFVWPDLNLSSWYGIVALGYTDSRGTLNSGVISRYKFKYGSYGVTTRSVDTEAVPAKTSGIKYGSVTDDMLKHVHVIR